MILIEGYNVGKDEHGFIEIAPQNCSAFKAMIGVMGFIPRPRRRHRKVLSRQDGSPSCF